MKSKRTRPALHAATLALPLALPLTLLSACVSGPAAPTAASVPQTPTPPLDTRGLEAVMGHSAEQLTRLFGEPRLNIIEGDARKLQFSGQPCVLDAYLYPQGRDEPVVTYVDARTPDGRVADRASCVAALRR